MDGIVMLAGQRHVVTECGTCGVFHTVPEIVYQQHRNEGGHHYCPNGHQWGWTKESCERERLRRERDRLKQRVAQKDDEIEYQKRRVAAAAGQITKMKNRSKAGVCPCCNRTFKQLASHMKQKHPDFDPKVVNIDDHQRQRA